MPERFFILVSILAAAFFIIRRFLTGRSNVAADLLPDIPGINPDFPTIIYFWTEQCSQCFNMQNPVLSKLKQSYNDFNLVSYNAFDEEEIVKELNIKTVPATVIIPSNRREAKFINNGFAGEKMLLSQIKEATL